MKKNKIIMILANHRNGDKVDIEVPLDITANELIVALNESFKLGMNTEEIYKCYLSTENPIALVKGNKTLAEYGLRDGTVINIV